MKKRTQTSICIGLGMLLVCSVQGVLADSAVGPGGGGAGNPPPITPPPVTPPDGSPPHQKPPSGNAIRATTGLPPGAKAVFVDTRESPATPPPGTAVGDRAIRITGTLGATAPVGLKLPGAAPGLKVGRLNEATGIWEVVGVIEKNGKFFPPDDGVYVVLR